MLPDFKWNIGYSCGGGNDITTWDDGSTITPGTIFDVNRCKEECKTHSECAGFVQLHSSRACDYYKKAPLELTQDHGVDRDCWTKIPCMIVSQIMH